MRYRYLSTAVTVALSVGISASSFANTIVFNPRTHTYTAVNDSGKVVRSGRASGGADYLRDVHRSGHTPVGSYRVWSMGSAACKSSRYPLPHGGARMPYCMFFSKNYAIHGSNDVPNRNASHGCIRVNTSDARWLSQNFVHIGTKVIVKPY